MIAIYGKRIQWTRFPDGTSQVWKLDQEVFRRFVHVVWKFENEGEFMPMAQLKRLLDNHGSESSLYMPFLPYARQDKQHLNDSCGALRVFAELINTLNFVKVKALDPHNIGATDELIENFYPISPKPLIDKAIEECKPDYICFPDKGAKSRYTGMFDPSLPYFYFEKVRDPITGHIESMECAMPVPDKGATVLIVDDICDGGMTFIKCADALISTGIKDVFLYTTHGIYSKGLRVLKAAGISRIFCSQGEVAEFDASGLGSENLVYKPYKGELDEESICYATL